MENFQLSTPRIASLGCGAGYATFNYVEWFYLGGVQPFFFQLMSSTDTLPMITCIFA